MSELEDIRKHAAEQVSEEVFVGLDDDTQTDIYMQVRADLDRALAIAEEQQRDLDEMTGGMWSVDHSQLIRERDEAIAAVRTLRAAADQVADGKAGWSVLDRALADTDVAWEDTCSSGQVGTRDHE